MPENIPLPLGNLQTEAKQFFDQAWQQYQAKDYQSAIDTCQRALEIYRQLNDQISMARVLDTIGISYYQLSRFHEALASYQLALPIADPNQKGNILDNIGLVLFEQGEFFKALDSYNQALVDRHNRKDKNEIRTINNLIATATALRNHHLRIKPGIGNSSHKPTSVPGDNPSNPPPPAPIIVPDPRPTK